ncbi:MAG: SCO family protein [Bacteroidetes bacterium]|nr:SCO family protein [Bacteroidota bacterium]
MARQRSRIISTLIVTAVAILLPLFFYVLAKSLGKDKLAMPVYYAGSQPIPAKQAKQKQQQGTLKPVADLQAINQFGDPISLNKNLAGKMLAIDFIFTRCTDYCPRLTEQMHQLEYAFHKKPMKQNDTMVQFISITVDPEHDSAGVLRAYAHHAGADENRWWFLTGAKKTIYQWMRGQLHLAVPDGNGGADDFIHTQKIVLLDEDRYIRGYYDGLDTNEIIRCANDLGLLAMEKK